jgi:hypothetical protein
MGVAPSEFWELTPRETWNAIDGYNERENAEYRTSWEQTRWLGAIVANGYLKHPKSPRKLLPFPWDNESAGAPEDEIQDLREELGWESQEH